MKEIEVEISSKKSKLFWKILEKTKKMLDDYNNYTKEYIKHYKKSLISFLKYPYMKAKQEALYLHLSDAKRKFIVTVK